MSRLKLEGCSYLAHDQNNNLKQLYPHLGSPQNYTGLLSCVWQQGNYWIYNSESLVGNEDYHHTKMAWQVVSLQNLKHRKLKSISEVQARNAPEKPFEDCVELKQGDIVKFGRVRFRIKRLVHTPTNNQRLQNVEAPDLLRQSTSTMAQQLMQTQYNLDLDQNPEDGGFMPDQQPEDQPLKPQPSISNVSNVPMCRVCLEEEEEGHELVAPCKCTGGIKYIGAKCLREWLDQKRQFKEGPIVNSYIWKGLECELCKSAFPDSVVGKHGQVIELLNFKLHD